MSIGPYRELEFDLPGALRARLLEMFSEMTTVPLLRNEIEERIPNNQGVYQIFHRDELVYVGKTDSDSGLKSRLIRHGLKIQNREGLVPSEVTFKAIRLFVFTVMDLESELIKASKPAWNGGGFGSNDPGRERDTTKIKAGNFDALYPLDIHRVVTEAFPDGVITAEEAIRHVRSRVPWKFRRENSGGLKPHADLDTSMVKLVGGIRSPWDVIEDIVGQLPAGWRGVALKSHVILYKDSKVYPNPLAEVRSPDGQDDAVPK